MTSAYTAHITLPADDPDARGVHVTSGDDEHILSTYDLTDEDGVSEAIAVLRDHGWAITGEPTVTDRDSHTTVAVQPHDWLRIVSDAKQDVEVYTSAALLNIRVRRDRWQAVIREAMHAPGTTKTKVAEAAGISRERAYQIRDGRR